MMKKPEKLIYMESELSQQSEAWHTFRQWGLGGSDVACLMFSAFNKTYDQLWEEKVVVQLGFEVQKRWEPTTPEEVEAERKRQATIDRGNRLEPQARDAYAKKFRCTVDQMCAIHPKNEWMRTSLDGIRRNRRAILEIKCPKNLKNHDGFTKGGKLPTWRYAQTQHSFAVMKAHFPQLERLDYISYFVEEDEQGNPTGKTDLRVIQVKPNNKYIKELIRREKIFMGYVDRQERPPVNLFREGQKLIARVKPLPLPTN